MKNRFLSIILALMLTCFAVIPSLAFSDNEADIAETETAPPEEEVYEEEETEENAVSEFSLYEETPYTYSVISEDEKTIAITGVKSGIKFSGHVDIPSEIDGYTVTVIGDAAFGRGAFNDVTSVVIPETVTKMTGNNHFYYCRNIYSVTMPSEMTGLGVGTFTGCRSLFSIVIPKGVTKLEKTFRECTSLTNVTIPSSVTQIDAYTFASTVGGTDIMPGITVRCAIGSFAEQFAKSKGMNVAYSEGPLFSYSENGDGTITLNDMASDVEIIGTLEIPEIFDDKTVTGIGDRAFKERNDIVSIKLPESIKTIGSEAFAYCEKISVFEIPKGVTSLDKTFLGCTGLKTVTIPDTVTEISEETFFAAPKDNGGYPIKRLLIYCTKGSAAEEYAKKYSIDYEAEGDLPDAWDGSVDTSWYDPDEAVYHISTPAALAGVRELVNSGSELFFGKTVILDDDINMKGTVWKIGIGYYTDDKNAEERSFNGIFDGNKHVIYNFTYNSNASSDTAGISVPPEADHKLHGLFGFIGIYGELRNLGLADEHLCVGNKENKVETHIGGLAGRNRGKITHCYVNGIAMSGGYYGSFCTQRYAGIAASNMGTIEDCFVKDIDFTGVEAQINASQKAGIATGNSGVVKDCYTANLIYSDGEGYYQWNDDGSGKSKCPVMFYYDSVVFANSGQIENVYSTDTFCRNGWDVGKRAYTDFSPMTEKMNIGIEKLTFRTIERASIDITVEKTDGGKAGINPQIVLEFTQPANAETLNDDTITLKYEGEKTNSVSYLNKDEEDYPYICYVLFTDSLKWRSEYEISVSGVKDYWNREVEAAEQTFETTGEIVCLSFELYENYGLSGEKKITSAKNVSGPVTAVIKGLKNNSINQYEAILSIGIIADGGLIAGAAKEVVIPSFETNTGAITVTVPYTASGGSAPSFIQAVLYKASGNAVPLIKSVRADK